MGTQHIGVVTCGAFFLALALGFSASPAFADPLKQAAMASQHAGLAANAPDAKTTEMHLHHVVNCLVGPGGDGFDASVANPCKDLGNGAEREAADVPQAKAIHRALGKAKSGLRYIAKDWRHAQRYATEAQAALAPIVATASK